MMGVPDRTGALSGYRKTPGLLSADFRHQHFEYENGVVIPGFDHLIENVGQAVQIRSR